MATPIIHQLPYDPDTSVFEYRLPVDISSLSAEHQKLLTPWWTRYNGLPQAKVQELLRSDWEAIQDDTARILADHLLEREPHAIIIKGSKICLALADHIGAKDVVCISEPRILTDADEQMLREFMLPGLRDFLTHFSPLAEGLFLDINCFMGFAESRLVPEGHGNCGEWFGAWPFYYIASGNLLVVNPQGKVAYWNHDRCDGDYSPSSPLCAKPLDIDFASLVQKYVDYLSVSEVWRRRTIFY